MPDQTVGVWAKSERPWRAARFAQIPAAVRVVPLGLLHARFRDQSVRQELSIREMCQRIVRVRSRMGRRSVPTLPRKIQVSNTRLPTLSTLWFFVVLVTNLNVFVATVLFSTVLEFCNSAVSQFSIYLN